MNEPGDSEEEVLAQIGVLLLLVQDFEFLLKFVVSVALKKRSEVTIDALTRKDTRTMGKFISDLRKDASLVQSVDQLLDRVLKGRNLFVHNLRSQPWFDTTTTRGRDAIWRFFAEFQPALQEALMIFTAFVFDYGKKIGFPERYEDFPWFGDFYERIKRDYMPGVDQKIQKKA